MKDDLGILKKPEKKVNGEMCLNDQLSLIDSLLEDLIPNLKTFGILVLFSQMRQNQSYLRFFQKRRRIYY